MLVEPISMQSPPLPVHAMLGATVMHRYLARLTNISDCNNWFLRATVDAQLAPEAPHQFPVAPGMIHVLHTQAHTAIARDDEDNTSPTLPATAGELVLHIHSVSSRWPGRETVAQRFDGARRRQPQRP